MARLNEALALADRGFYVFPCEVGGKLPVIKDWPNRATRDVATITKWFDDSDYNIGISTSHFQEGKALVVVDVDNKKGKSGDTEIFNLEMQGFELPVTFEQSTPSGGRHIIYVADIACKQGVNVLGPGIDIRSRGGFIVGPGSTIGGRDYKQINGHGVLAPCPAWLVNRLGQAPVLAASPGVVLPGVDADRAEARAVDYLKTAPVSTEGDGGDLTAFKVAAKLKDMGCTMDAAASLMTDQWNDRCDPPWDVADLQAKVRHAFQYGKELQGSAAAEAVFAKVTVVEATAKHPVHGLNDEYAFVKKGAFVLQETTDEDGNPKTEHLNMAEFHGWFANKTFAPSNQKPKPLSDWWLEWTGRREYEAVVFAPQQNPGPRWYNLWTGFSVEAATSHQHPAVQQFLDHALQNVCGGDTKLFHWLMGFFAHMIQKPWEKPLVALVFCGAKGTGKNALVERVGHLLGQHFLVADDPRYLVSNFNSHLESNLFFALDEASWAGDKRAEGKLKGLITGAKHNIERKGKEGYRVKNLTRVAIIGNEKWLVPATVVERRFAVFNVGNGKRQDRAFFESMRVGMEQGGYANLLTYFQQFDLSTVDVNDAPQTKGLVDQKHASLDAIPEWWLDCLKENQLAGDSFDGPLPVKVPTNRMQTAFEVWARKRNIRSRLPTKTEFNAEMRSRFGEMKKAQAAEPGDTSYSWYLGDIAMLRAAWETFIGGAVHWNQ